MHNWYTVSGAFSLHLIALRRGGGEQTGKQAQHTYSSSSTTRRMINALHYNQPTSRPQQSAQPSTFWLSAHEAWSTGRHMVPVVWNFRTLTPTSMPSMIASIESAVLAELLTRHKQYANKSRPTLRSIVSDNPKTDRDMPDKVVTTS